MTFYRIIIRAPGRDPEIGTRRWLDLNAAYRMIQFCHGAPVPDFQADVVEEGSIEYLESNLESLYPWLVK